MKTLNLLIYLKSATLVFLISLCLVCSGYAAGRDVTLQWDKSIDDPYIQAYNVYYYTTSDNTESLNDEDYAVAYTLPGVVDPIAIAKGGLKPITIDKSNIQITLHFLDNSKGYYFVVTAVDTRGIEGVPTPEISIMKLTVSKAGTGAGTVVSSSLGIRSNINCGSKICSADYIGGTTVTLTATPNAGHFFTGWSDSGCSGTGSCSVTMNGDKTATAEFSLMDKRTYHPADTTNDFRIAINECTSYHFAWKTGATWSVGPNPIPIEYITNACFLWKAGEVYRFDGTVPSGTPPYVTGP